MIPRRQFILSMIIGCLTGGIFRKSMSSPNTTITAELNAVDDIKITDNRVHCIPTKFHAKHEYGRGIELRGIDDKDGIAFLRKDAEMVLPKGTHYDLRMAIGNLNRNYLACWYYSPHTNFLLGYNKSPDKWIISLECGCYKMGGFLA